jgi:hypothetical protein
MVSEMSRTEYQFGERQYLMWPGYLGVQELAPALTPLGSGEE